MRPATIDTLEQQIRDAMDTGNWTQVGVLGRALDRAASATVPTLPGAALWYAEQGLHVFPLQPGSKVPMPRSNGCKDATLDPDRIRTWWARTPGANIGIATGHLVDVIDIDGPVGVGTWAGLLAEPDGLPPVAGTVNTPRPGGTHLYVAASGRGNKAGLFPGVDYRGAGGYVVAPPSIITGGPDVKHPGIYTWRRPITTAGLNTGQVAA